MIYGYARVSSKGQERYGNSLDDQHRKLVEAGCAKIYEDSFTGTKMERPEFSALLSVLQPGDTLVVTKLDRFARTAADGAKIIQSLMNRGIIVDILNMGRADNTPMGKLMVTIMLAFAEFERDMIVERTSAGKTVARSKNPQWREGRKPVSVDPAVFHECLARTRCKEITVDECCKRLGICRATWYKLVRDAA